MIVLCGLSIAPSAQAHLIGKSDWCLSNSPVHFECFFESIESCEKMGKMRGKMPATKGDFDSSDWSCTAYPHELAEKLQSQNPEQKTPVAPTKTP